MTKYKNRRAEAASQKTSARKGKRVRTQRKVQMTPDELAFCKACELVDLFRNRGIPDNAISGIFDILLDMDSLNTKAMCEVLDSVKTFLRGKVPEPSENKIVTLTVATIMTMIIDSIEENNADNFRKHNNNK